ncbi:MAG: hypothetical protein AAB354_12590 [candidate division KSB1 bacterium]
MKIVFVFWASLALWNWPPSFDSSTHERQSCSTALTAPDTTAVRKPAEFFIAFFALGEAWQKEKPAHEQLYFKEHSANLKRLRQEKKLLIGGRYSDKGMLLLTAENEAAARAEFETDPMLAHKLFKLELHPFCPFYKGCVEGQ